MFCVKCGKENKDDSVFCFHCGNRLAKPQMTQKQPVYRMENRSVNKPLPKPKKAGPIALVICIIVLCLGIIGGIIALVDIGKNKIKEVNHFINQVEAFEEYLEGVNYSSVQDEIIDLMKD